MIGKKVIESEVTMMYLPMPNEANEYGSLHGGHIFRHIDNAGGVVAQRHSRYLVVTVTVDRMDFLAPVLPGQVMILKASIHLVGRSSMDIGVRLEVENPKDGQIKHAGTCFMTYVAVDDQGHSMEVPPLILESEDQHRRHAQALQRRQYRESLRQK